MSTEDNNAIDTLDHDIIRDARMGLRLFSTHLWGDAEDDHCWQLFLMSTQSPYGHGMQIIKAPKTGTPYAEYWPTEEQARYIVAALNALPLLHRDLSALWSLLPEATGWGSGDLEAAYPALATFVREGDDGDQEEGDA